ncbi:hypothetical protein SCHPADRAFT_312960 [Schizopora paradoxa]|uniref:Uncharacterized protein n=1 Tax=Schizopora paradoxa TaxID=27342 RepID=A0A0H2SC41_9AGAM|nr:hypothetical protein SCHPADRAFT_312960 [Schizopora paradoxa]
MITVTLKWLKLSAALVFFSNIPAGGASKAKKYRVETIQVLADSKSKVFRARWSALRALEDIHNADRGQTPQESRKEKWLLEGYMDLAVADHAKKAKSSGTTFLLRKPHRSEIKNILGRHAVWLRQYVKRKKLLNLNFWDSFIRESRGRLNGEHYDDDELDNASSSSKSSREPDNMDQTPADDPNDRKTVLRAPLGPEGYAHTFTYLEEDATSFTNQQDKHFCHALNLLDIPLEPFQRPVLSANLDWHCPFSTCNYYVDLRNLDMEILNDLSLNEKKFLQSKFWNGEDDELLEIFYNIAERHKFRHLEDLHIDLLVYEKNVSDELVSERIRAPKQIEEGQEGLQLSTRPIRRRSHLANFKTVERNQR